MALKACKKRLYSMRSRVSDVYINLDQDISIAGKLWQNDSTLTSAFAKLRQTTNKLNLRGGEYVRFSSFHTTKTRWVV